uniref:FYVE-type domain-containing protein n=1 Tax=Mycena chlorophos TaxID=658473 RepID=A0ABQ0M8V4_MYCCL|nr:predicted protein [Mycena chlorophos]
MADNNAAPSVPYQAYRSKRHSRTPSNPTVRTIPIPVSPSSPPASRPTSFLAPSSPPPTAVIMQNGNGTIAPSEKVVIEIGPLKSEAIESPPLPVVVLSTSPPTSSGTGTPSPPLSPVVVEPEPAAIAAPVNGNNGAPTPTTPTTTNLPLAVEPPSPGASSSSAVAAAAIADDRPRKTSTFRRVPRNSRAPLPSSPLAGGLGHTRTLSASQPTPEQPPQRPQLQQQRPASVLVESRDRIPSLSSSPSSRPSGLSSPPDGPNRRYSTPLNADAVSATLAVVAPPQRTSSLQAVVTPASISRASSSQTTRSRQTSPTPVPPSPSALSPPQTPFSSKQASAPYRPGFQPKGVYRPRTDEFIAHRQAHAISAGYASAERTKLERRLEKLIALHFPEEGKSKQRPGLAATQQQNRRASSFFDLDIKGILSGGKEDTRAAEQRITPWQEDKDVTKCPLCVTNFHPLTNRKHHCRLCGQIICALPVKRPQRPQPCSILFVVDPKTREIEEVGEGVDYGVRKRKISTPGGPPIQTQELAEEEKFLRGVRICRECRPVLLRQQYYQQAMHVPSFVKLYDAFVALEKEIEDSLPAFQELILTLNQESQPTKEASAARKRLLEAFAQYDAIAKRIRNLPTPNKGGSQERVQMAVMTRANLFLQKNMFPLQSLPTPKRTDTSGSGSGSSTPPIALEDDTIIDPSSATALALQPLLEQEALLETYVEEAKAQRKFEDAKTLRLNLGEIRAEIERILEADGGAKSRRVKKGR